MSGIEDPTEPPPVRYGGFTVKTQCLKCGQMVPVNGLKRQLECWACKDSVQIARGHLAEPLRTFESRGGPKQDGDTICTMFRMKQGREAVAECERMVPVCGSCGTPLPVDDVPVGADTTLHCGCGKSCTTFPAPEWVRRQVPSAVQLYGADRDDDRTPEGVQAEVAEGGVQPIVMACPQCAASLEFTQDTPQKHPCRFCGTEIVMPGELWKLLHPPVEARRWYVRFEGLSRGRPKKRKD